MLKDDVIKFAQESKLQDVVMRRVFFLDVVFSHDESSVHCFGGQLFLYFVADTDNPCY
jgi:hypothetical protein